MRPISVSAGVTENEMVSFQGSKYSDPLLCWEQSRGAHIGIFKSDNLAQEYENIYLKGI